MEIEPSKHVKADWIVGRERFGLSCKVHRLVQLGVGRAHVAKPVELQDMRNFGERSPVGAVERDRLTVPPECLLLGLHVTHRKRVAAKEALIGRQIGGRLAARLLNSGSLDPTYEGADDLPNKLVLDVKHVVLALVVVLGPDQRSAPSLEEPARDPPQLAPTTDGPLEHELHAQIAREIL